MSLFDSASLVVTPSGYKEDKLYSIKPTDGSGDLVVTRATTATRVNSDGLIEQVPYNLAQYSNTFTNSAWVKNACTITANSIISPDGTQNASKLVESTANDSHHIYQNAVASGVNTFSFYAKAGERNFVYAYADSVGQGKCFDLQNGTVGANIIAAPSNATITSVGNGWYRCTITLTIGSASALRIGACSANGTFSYLGNGTSGIYIYGAQLNSGATAREYFPTTDRLDIPRLDYTNSSCPSILVEPQRTNLILRSQEFDNASWTKPGVNVTANNTTSPTGLIDAELLTTSTSGAAGIYQFITTGSGTFSFSVFAKKGNNNYFALNVQVNSSNNCTAVFDLSDGTLGEYQTKGTTSYISHKIESYGNGWYRCTIVFSTTSTIPYFFPMFAPLKTGNSFTSSGEVNGNTSGKTLYLFGAQVEAGSYATSYVPTVASSVTRNTDIIYKTGISSLIGQTEGTVFIDFVWNQLTGIGSYPRIIELWKDSGNYIQLFNVSGTSTVYWDIYSGGSVQFSGNTSMSLGRNKLAIGYKNNDFVFYKNGILVASDSSGTIPTTNDLGIFGVYNGGAGATLSGSMKSTMLWKERLSNTELANLTTI